jgi:hypothetical protein
MDLARDPMTGAAKAARPERPPPERPLAACPAPNLDLDRLVWDPEYREAMRPWLGPES